MQRDISKREKLFHTVMLVLALTLVYTFLWRIFGGYQNLNMYVLVVAVFYYMITRLV